MRGMSEYTGASEYYPYSQEGVKSVTHKQLGEWRVQIVEYTSPHRFWAVYLLDGEVPLCIGAIYKDGKIKVWTPAARSRRFNKQVKTIVLETVVDWLRGGKFIPASLTDVETARRDAATGSFVTAYSDGSMQRAASPQHRKSLMLERLERMPVGTQAAFFRSNPDGKGFTGPYDLVEKGRGGLAYKHVDKWLGPDPR
jgi:hypothetical protein